MSTEYKTKQEFPNLYSILGISIDVCKESNCNELIKKAYMKKAKVCHPDKHPGRKDIEEIFELLTGAYDILKDEQQRSQYNHKLSLHKESSNDFFNLKKKSEKYYGSTGEYKQLTKDQEKSIMDEQNKILDEKHGYKREIEKTPLSKGESKRMLKDLEKSRAQQDVELKHEKLFDEAKTDMRKFNAVFDKYHVRENDSIVLHNGVPLAWNGLGTVANYSAFDDLDNMYVDDSDRVDTSKQNYVGINFGNVTSKINKSEISELKGAKYYDTHNDLGDDYYAEMKAKLRDRESTNSKYDKMSFTDFKRDDTAGYGIFDQLGMKYEDRLCLDDDDSITAKFEKLMIERQQL